MNFSYPRLMMPTLLTVERPSAVRAAMRWLNPPRRSGISMSAPFSSTGPMITAEWLKLRWPNRQA